MKRETMMVPQRIFPTFRYRDAPAMIEWLGKAFGFEVREQHMDGERVAHAELCLGSSLIMLGSARDDEYGAMVGEPSDQGGKSVYIACEDPDALFRSAKAAGARMLTELVEKDYGSRDFICADPEGNVWCFGTYWPKASDRQ